MGFLVAVRDVCGRMISMTVVLKPVTGSVPTKKDEFLQEACPEHSEMSLAW